MILPHSCDENNYLLVFKYFTELFQTAKVILSSSENMDTLMNNGAGSDLEEDSLGAC
jgi:hypothetical protein